MDSFEQMKKNVVDGLVKENNVPQYVEMQPRLLYWSDAMRCCSMRFDIEKINENHPYYLKFNNKIVKWKGYVLEMSADYFDYIMADPVQISKQRMKSLSNSGEDLSQQKIKVNYNIKSWDTYNITEDLQGELVSEDCQCFIIKIQFRGLFIFL
jgi:hypothetical protein